MAVRRWEDFKWPAMAGYGSLAHCVKMVEDRINTKRHVFCMHVFLKNANANDLGSYFCLILDNLDVLLILILLSADLKWFESDSVTQGEPKMSTSQKQTTIMLCLGTGKRIFNFLEESDLSLSLVDPGLPAKSVACGSTGGLGLRNFLNRRGFPLSRETLLMRYRLPVTTSDYWLPVTTIGHELDAHLVPWFIQH